MAQPDVATLLGASEQLCPTPIDSEFYATAGVAAAEAAATQTWRLDGFDGLAVDLQAGQAVTLELLEGAQIVNLFAFNPHDPDERMWQQSTLREGLFYGRHSRLWGTMARYRPLLTVLEDTVCADPEFPRARHHPYAGGSGTPADWLGAGGSPEVPSTWEQFGRLLDGRGVPRHLLRENLCLFQRSYVDGDSTRIHIVPSCAVAGDRVSLFAEIDVCVLLTLSPFIDGARAASEPGLPQPRAVRVTRTERLAEPLPWPYPGVPYPDLDLYLDASGTRSAVAGGTPGVDYRMAL